MHESEIIALMGRVSYIFQTVHHCSVAFSDWKVADMTLGELQQVASRQRSN
jgi:hypothetical protein